MQPDLPDDAARPAVEVGVPLAHTAGLLTVTRLAMGALWPDPFAQPRDVGVRYVATFTTAPTFDATQPAFRWDGDPVGLNVVGHGLLGLELYGRPRQCGLGPARSLLFAFAASTVWEYGFEGNARVPSAQDLVFTPLAGFALGELRYQLIRRKPRLRPLVDPLGEVERTLGAGC